jgi:ribulose bisphosphate carboxylase small subunit
VQVRKVIKRRVVTTIVPSPGQNTVSASPVSSSSSYSAGAEPVVTSSS